EDGIRVPLVTGVQTCALPILLNENADFIQVTQHLPYGPMIGPVLWNTVSLPENQFNIANLRIDGQGQIYDQSELKQRAVDYNCRSEERRVGKECRYGQ